MTNVELIQTIRNEIERRMKENYEHEGSFEAGRMVEDADLLSFLDTLESEKPTVTNDLVAELKHHLATTPKEQLEKEWKELEPWGNVGPTVEEFLGWQKEKSEKPMQDGLEKEYQEFCKDYPFPWSSQYVNREYIDELCLSVARHFAQWGAEHLKK